MSDLHWNPNFLVEKSIFSVQVKERSTLPLAEFTKLKVDRDWGSYPLAWKATTIFGNGFEMNEDYYSITNVMNSPSIGPMRRTVNNENYKRVSPRNVAFPTVNTDDEVDSLGHGVDDDNYDNGYADDDKEVADSGAQTAEPEAAKDQKACSVCTLLNDPVNLFCEVCGARL